MCQTLRLQFALPGTTDLFLLCSNVALYLLHLVVRFLLQSLNVCSRVAAILNENTDCSVVELLPWHMAKIGSKTFTTHILDPLLVRILPLLLVSLYLLLSLPLGLFQAL